VIIIPKDKKNIIKELLEKNISLFTRLYDIILWPIIQPLVSNIELEKQERIEEETRKFFFSILMKESERKKIEVEIRKIIPKEDEVRIAYFIIGLVNDFTNSFYDEIILKQKPKQIIESVQQLIDQQIVINWIEQAVQQSLMPILIYSLKTQANISDAQQAITKVLLAIIQEQITAEEASNQVATVLGNIYNVPEEVILFIQSFVRTVAIFGEKNGLEGLARIGEASYNKDNKYAERNKQIIQAAIDPIIDRKRIIKVWVKNILDPSCIALKIGGKEIYEDFIQKCKLNFELFLDNSLSAEDFEKRLDIELKKFGGDDEELILPIRESIASSVRFLEIARIEDPSLSLLLMIMDDEKENMKKFYG